MSEHQNGADEYGYYDLGKWTGKEYVQEGVKHPDGRIEYADGRIMYPDGRIEHKDGRIEYKDGRVVYKDGHVEQHRTEEHHATDHHHKEEEEKESYTYLMGMFDDEVPLLNAIEKIRASGLEIHDALSPFPVHGIDDALGARETKLHTAGFIFGATGTAFALLAISAISVINWPNNFGGKPYFALPGWIPIGFELTVLFSAVGMTIVYYLRNGLSVFKDIEPLDPRTSSDRFALVFDMNQQYKSDADINRISGMLNDLGALEVKQRTVTTRHPSHEEQSTVGFQGL